MTLASSPLAGAASGIKAMVAGWAGCGEHEEKLTRVFLSPQHKACAQAVMSAMRAAGMTARIDAIGNVVGRYEAAEQEGGGHENRAPAARTLITGSHIDTVREAGAYDGNLGRSEEHTSELQSLMRISYAVFCLKKQKTIHSQK